MMHLHKEPYAVRLFSKKVVILFLRAIEDRVRVILGNPRQSRGFVQIFPFIGQNPLDSSWKNLEQHFVSRKGCQSCLFYIYKMYSENKYILISFFFPTHGISSIPTPITLNNILNICTYKSIHTLFMYFLYNMQVAKFISVRNECVHCIPVEIHVYSCI